MSQPGYVGENTRYLGAGIAELPADPNHYRRSGMEVVNYGDDPQHESEEQLSRRQLLRMLFSRKASA